MQTLQTPDFPILDFVAFRELKAPHAVCYVRTYFNALDKYWMRQALAQAQQAEHQGEVPVGAILVHQHRMIGQGFNCPITSHDPTAHAEITALRHACTQLKNYRLPENTTLYVTLEPCTQCVGALIHARVSRVIFATTEPKAGALMSARKLLLNTGYYNHRFYYVGGLLQQQSKQLLQDFFKKRRMQSAKSKTN